MIVSNRKARYSFDVIEEFDCGIILTGNEVKSIRRGDVTIGDSFAYMKSGEIWIKNMKVAPYKQAHKLDKHDENRDKKLLLNKKELNKIDRMLGDKGTTIVPLSIFINKNRLKVKIGVCKGKKLWNKKEDIKSRDLDRDAKRELNFR
jgi:SsrA-binding protein